MEMLRTAVSALSFSDAAEAATDAANERRKAVGLLAQVPTIIARHHRRRLGLEPVAPDASLSYPRTSSPCCAATRPPKTRRMRSTC